jgi:hypothetical protein
MNRPSRRAIAATVTLCVFGMGIAAVSLRVRRHLIRVHAQHTIDEIQHVEIGTLRACQIFSEWHKEWESHLASQGSCDDPNRFYMDINVQNPPHIWSCFEGQAGNMRFLLARATCSVYEALSGKPIVFTVRIEAIQGVVNS